MHQVARFDDRRPRQPRFQRAIHVRKRRLGQKPQRAQIDRQDRRIRKRKRPRRSQQRPIPAQHYDQVRRVLRHILPLDRVLNVGLQISRTLRVENVLKPMLRQPATSSGSMCSSSGFCGFEMIAAFGMAVV